ncbi:unnamed protein product [Lymnaea stagnalis]|uniref:very-long-chain enoyl-CoA reductase n=1 Tax=Lymnaea stagnalis TaxID=6523 RepID=A0AAV2I0R3_LYMST
MEVNVIDSKSGKSVATLGGLSPKSTVLDIKNEFSKIKPKYYPDRQAFKLDIRGKMLKDEDTLESLSIDNQGKLFFKDLGPQVGWATVFLTEYAGPLVIYLIFYTRPALVYGIGANTKPYADVVKIAAGCWTFHYAKRLLETLFVHRFSHSTMPIFNIFKNSIYYWGFAAFVAYFVNHPLYTPPAYGENQVWLGLAGFVFAELGNFSVHVALRNLRPPGSKERRIPLAGLNPFTWLFKVVSCPNYTYEVMAWTGFTIMTQCLPAGVFCLAGFYQMSVWAIGKHRNYIKEFKDYPRSRKAIIPFLL